MTQTISRLTSGAEADHLVKRDDHVHVNQGPGKSAWQGYVYAVTSTTITLIDWCAWHMGDNRPTEGKPNETLTLNVTDDFVLLRTGEDDDVVVTLPAPKDVEPNVVVKSQFGEIETMPAAVFREHYEGMGWYLVSEVPAPVETVALTADEVERAAAATFKDASGDRLTVDFEIELDEPVTDARTADAAAATITALYWQWRGVEDMPVHADGDEHDVRENLLAALRVKTGATVARRAAEVGR